MSEAAPLWQGRKVLVCVGTGGVGKTTVAAAVAIAAAQAGRRVLVMTIDPSLRLAQSLGISARRGEVAPIDLADGAQGGSLSALVLDVQSTFDQLIERRAKDAAMAAAIKSNRIYQHFAASLAGSHEYAAIERLFDGVNDDRFDLVVLDTPPAQNALDFLEAPRRILDFLEGQAIVDRVPAGGLAKRLGRRLFALGGSVFKSNVAKIAGGETLDEVLAFLAALTSMYDSFKERALAVEALLQSEACAFVLVGSSQPAQQGALARFAEQLAAFGIAPQAYVLNRLRRAPVRAGAPAPKPAEAPAARWRARAHEALAAMPEPLATGAAASFVAAVVAEGCQAEHDAAALELCRRRAKGRPVYCLPEADEEVDNRASIGRMAAHFASARRPL